MRRKIRAFLATIPLVLLVLVTYVVLNWDDFLEGIGFIATWLGSAQGQFSTFIVLAGTVSNLYGKFRQSNLPKNLNRLFGWKKALRNLQFLNDLLDRFTFEEVTTLLHNVNVIQEDMKEAVRELTVALAIADPKPIPKPKAKSRHSRNALALAVAEQLRLLGKKVEVMLIEEKTNLGNPAELKQKVINTFRKPIDDAKAREEDRIRRLNEALKISQRRLASLLDTQKESKGSAELPARSAPPV